MENTFMSAAPQLLNEGMQRGMQQGMQQGSARTVLRLLERRFGSLDAATTERVADATLEELETIAAGLLDAPTLSAVFGA
ncbi:MAG: DUF4351 domain-containing protein [Planctomycetes bacterium]|nr:DUF4351 domain-containing protein [Planctomycetota bacterium]